MHLQKFTVSLIPQDEGGYQVFFPYYPNCTTDGDSVQEALTNGKDALEGLLMTESKNGGDPVPPYVFAPHVVVAEADIDIQVPDSLVEKQRAATGAV
jgi:predicted RNase H-like HicB family nuclease